MLSYSDTKNIETPWDYTKKKTTLYKEQDSEKIKTYQDQIKGIPLENIAYIDKIDIVTHLFRGHCCVVKTKNTRKNQQKHKWFGIVIAKIGEKIVAPMEYGGTMDSLLFETWFVQHFLPVIRKGTVIVMDNASFHRQNSLFVLHKKRAAV